MSQWLINIWYRRSIWSYCLFPFSLIYLLIIKIRFWLYRSGFKKITRFPIPIIVVGNLTVGGTGKTPLVIYLAKLLRDQGLKPGIVTRGYGGKAEHYPCVATQGSSPQQVGDEAILLAAQADCLVVVDPNRVNAVNYLLQNYDCNVVISDDGLQHYALGRNIEIVVIDGQRRFGNNFCLPAGPLREPVTRLSKVNFIVVNGEAKAGEIAMQLIPDTIYNLKQPEKKLDIHNLQDKTVHAVAGIGNPKRFFDQLRELKFSVIEHPFPDHHVYRSQDLNFDDNHLIVMTEKDAVKCREFSNEKIWCLPVSAKLNSEFDKQLLAILLPLSQTSHFCPSAN